MAKNLAGNVYGSLTVVQYIGELLSEYDDGAVLNFEAWECKCSCGRTLIEITERLTSIPNISCGCSSLTANAVNLTGKRFNMLTVLGFAYKVSKNLMWYYICDCGAVGVMRGDRFKHNRSCGCKRRGAGNHRRTKRLRRAPQYRPMQQSFRRGVLLRDNYTCQACGETEGKLCAHHLEAYASNPELASRVDNGITLCARCHEEFHREWGREGDTTAWQFAQWLNTPVGKAAQNAK